MESPRQSCVCVGFVCVCVYTCMCTHLIVPRKSVMVGGEGVSVYMCVT